MLQLVTVTLDTTPSSSVRVKSESKSEQILSCGRDKYLHSWRAIDSPGR